MAAPFDTGWLARTPDRPKDDGRPQIYSLQQALVDFALVTLAAAVLFILLVVTGATEPLLAWTASYPQLELSAMFLYAVLLAVGLGVALLRRWMQITESLREQAVTRAELAAKARDVDRKNRELERFAYAASHDLREPLRMVHSYLSLLERQVDDGTAPDGGPVLDDEALGFLEEAKAASQRMDRLVRGILDYTRVSPEADISEPVDTDAALEDAVKNLVLGLQESDVEVEREPLPTVLARRDELAVLFQNLLQNALAHGDDELTRIEVCGYVDDGTTVIRVEDDGGGFSGVDPDRAFQLFRQGNGSSPEAGAGLGLALCRRIAERHDGSLEIVSGERGATATVRLPAADPDAGTTTDASEAALGPVLDDARDAGLA
jgi:signal transduction histidine kinase